jgi:hypothetical protein
MLLEVILMIELRQEWSVTHQLALLLSGALLLGRKRVLTASRRPAMVLLHILWPSRVTILRLEASKERALACIPLLLIGR